MEKYSRAGQATDDNMAVWLQTQTQDMQDLFLTYDNNGKLYV